jgi:sugar phosphate isomerase/epimerase
MTTTRRTFLAAGAGSLLGACAWADAGKDAPRPHMGVVIHSYGIRRSADRKPGLGDPLTFLEHCRKLGAGGVQTMLGVRDEDYATRVRRLLDKHQLYLEGSIALPREKADVKRFSAEVLTLVNCGGTLFRTVLMGGRRYEVFKDMKGFRNFVAQAKQSLVWARPVVEKAKVRMAVENHKDLRAPELLAVLDKLDSRQVGVCLDTGNNLALLETPQETVDLLAPRAFTTHIKDMGVEEYAGGFHLAEVPLGTGFLDLKKVVATVRRARPDIHLNLEMITRDPLRIPCLTPAYWATLEDTSARRLAVLLSLVRSKAGKKPLPQVSKLSKEKQVEREEENVRLCLQYARKHLDA